MVRNLGASPHRVLVQPREKIGGTLIMLNVSRLPISSQQVAKVAMTVDNNCHLSSLRQWISAIP